MCVGFLRPILAPDVLVSSGKVDRHQGIIYCPHGTPGAGAPGGRAHLAPGRWRSMSQNGREDNPWSVA